MNCKQYNVIWYADDTKILHEDSTVVDPAMNEIETRFRKMIIIWGKKHIFVRIDIECDNNYTVTLSMNQYIEEYVKIYDDEVKGKVSTPGSEILFEDDEMAMKAVLPEDDTNTIWSHDRQAIFLFGRVRVGIDSAALYLCTKVTNPVVGDEPKLKQVLSDLCNINWMKKCWLLIGFHIYKHG